MKLLLIGDSLTYGYRVDGKYKWTNILGEKLQVEIVNRGELGDTTAGMNLRLYEEVFKEKPNAVFMMGGTNDFLMGYSPENVQNNLEQMIKDVTAISLKVIVGIQPPTIQAMAEKFWASNVDYNKANDKIEILSKWIKRSSSQLHFHYIDFNSEFTNLLLKNDFQNYYLDGVHLNNNGHELMAKVAFDLINSITLYK